MQPATQRQLTDSSLLRLLMKRAPGGPHTLRSLALATGISRSRLHCLLNGEKPVTTEAKAMLIAEAVGTHAGAFFTDPMSTSMDMDMDSVSPEGTDGPE